MVSKGPAREKLDPFYLSFQVRFLNSGYGCVLLLFVFKLSFFLKRVLGFFPFFPAGFIFASLVWHIRTSLGENIPHRLLRKNFNIQV
jgi:hypothetical protein